MKNQWWQSLVSQQADGTAVANTTTATSILPAQAKQTLPAQFLDVIGSKLLLKAGGKISTAASAPGTLTLALMLGSTAAFSATSPTLTASQGNVTWDMEVMLTTRVVGSAAQLLGIGKLWSAAVGGMILLPLTSPAVGTAFDATTSQLMDLFATFSVANASNSITGQYLDISSIN